MTFKTLILCTAMTGALMLPTIAKAEDAMAPKPPVAEKTDHKGPHGNRMFDEADTNKDSKLSKEEFLARHEKKFGEIDADKDGSLTKDEMKAYGDSMREKFHDRREEHKEKMTDKKMDEKAPEAPAAK